MKLVHDFSYIDQSSYQDGNDANDADYLSVGIGPKFGKTLVTLNYEVLGGDGNYGFSTPLATLHAFNGWADMFLGTPANGLVDTFIKVVHPFAGFKCVFMAHDFQADEGDADYGREYDAVLSRAINKKVSVGVKAALYDAEDHGTDTTKIWLWGQLKL